MKVIIDVDVTGGFHLSKECILALGGKVEEGENGNYWTELPEKFEHVDDIRLRTDPLLIKLVEEKGSKWCSKYETILKIVEIPDGVDFYIDYCEGRGECIVEKHRVWR